MERCWRSWSMCLTQNPAAIPAKPLLKYPKEAWVRQKLQTKKMNTSTLYNPHVKPYPNFQDISTPFTPLDYTLGTLLILCSLVGIPGNISAALFFASSPGRDWVATLYTIICSVDTVTCLAHVPVVVALFRERKPGVFNDQLFCSLWDVLYTTLQKISIFLVLVLSTTRTIIIVNPLNKIRIKTVVGCVVGYMFLLLLIPLLQYLILPLRGEYKYSWDGVYCYYNFQMRFEHAVNLVMVGLPPILTFFTLLVTVFKLSMDREDLEDTGSVIKEWKNRANITIAMFTSLFLVCNLPLFINLMHNMATSFFGVEYPGVYLSTRFMFWYSWHIARMESVVVNAALNPVLYYCRMRKYRAWCNVAGKKLLPGGVERFTTYYFGYRRRETPTFQMVPTQNTALDLE
ncbi:hypothetical protein ACHWQZ_G014418 [Mnemiopsis leidyi]